MEGSGGRDEEGVSGDVGREWSRGCRRLRRGKVEENYEVSVTWLRGKCGDVKPLGQKKLRKGWPGEEGD